MRWLRRVERVKEMRSSYEILVLKQERKVKLKPKRRRDHREMWCDGVVRMQPDNVGKMEGFTEIWVQGMELVGQLSISYEITDFTCQ
jgi:hypothetical protein